MNWYRAKTILIILFLFTDLFLLVTLVSTGYKSNSVAPEVISAAAEVLKNSGIEIDSGIIPSLTRPLAYAEADNAISDYGDFAKSFLGENCEKTGETSYSNGADEIVFRGDGFTFKRATAAANVAGEKSARDSAEAFLKSKGFDLSSAEVSVEKKADRYYFTFSNKVNSVPIFNSVITAEMSGTEVLSVSGVWFNTASAKGTENELKSAASILIDFIQTAQPPTKITSVALGYTVPDGDVYHKAAALIPVWEITEANGAKHYFDARNPEA